MTYYRLPSSSFFLNHTPPTEIYTLSLHDALPISKEIQYLNAKGALTYTDIAGDPVLYGNLPQYRYKRSEERFSRNAETDLVCRLLLEKKKEKQGKTRGDVQTHDQPTHLDQHEQLG